MGRIAAMTKYANYTYTLDENYGLQVSVESVVDNGWNNAEAGYWEFRKARQ